jgi:hypothetical protein
MRFSALLAALLLTAPVLFATTIHVPADQPTIQAGINAAVNGDTVLVASGHYIGNIRFLGKNIVVRSENGPAATTIYALNPDSAVVRFVDAEPHGAEISGFTITGGGYSGIFCKNSSPIIKNNYITGNSCATDNDGGGISLKNTHGCLIKGNRIYDNSATRYGYGCAIHVGDDTSFSRNDTVCYNLIYDNSCHGADIRILRDVDSLEIFNNTIYVAGWNGILYQANGRVNIQNNIVFNAVTDGIEKDWKFSGTVVCEYNCLYENGQNLDNIVAGPGMIYTNAQFSDIAVHDYSLRYTSPCINAGNPDPKYNNPDGTRNDIGAIPYTDYPRAIDLNMFPDSSSHVISQIPIFRWTFYDTTGFEAGYHVDVATTGDWIRPDMWVSGDIVTGNNFAPYGGLPLMGGTTYYYRVKIYNGHNWGGWSLGSFHINGIPTVPSPIHPENGAIALTPTPTLYLRNSLDAESDSLSYDYEVYSDSSLITPIISVNGVAQQPDSTKYITSFILSDNAHYNWRARAYDGYEFSAWSEFSGFWMNSVEQPPSLFIAISPNAGDTTHSYDISPLFTWSAATDPDPLDWVYYSLRLTTDSLFLNYITVDSIFQVQHVINGLQYGAEYWWNAAAHDSKGNTSWSSNVAHFWTVIPGDANADGLTNVGDAVFLINYIFKGGREPVSLKIGDTNADCKLNVGDVVYMINYIFKGGPPPKVGCATMRQQMRSNTTEN